MPHHPLIDFALILVLGIGARWVAWRFHLPAILLLLVFGFVAGPATGVLDPDSLLGDLLTPLVSFSVALILFEGGLSLRLAELREIGGVVRNLVSVGILVTWVLASIAAHLLLELDLGMAALLGAILVVTGPTVIVPLLRTVRPTAQVASTLKWEGIFNDAIGAILAVLVFEAILAGDVSGVTTVVALGVLQTILISIALGAVAAAILVILLRRHWIPDFLDNPVSLMLVIGAFTVSNQFQAESGLLTVTVMGAVLANQRWAAVRHIIEFKENLRVLLISSLFIILAARVGLDELRGLDWRAFVFLGLLILVVRPAAVFVSTLRSRLDWRERVLLSWIAPRGIVAAAVSSAFALGLVAAGHPEGARLVPLVFLVIVGTVVFSGLTARPLARLLGIAGAAPQGVLLVGAHYWARQIASTLIAQGIPARLADTNWNNISLARMDGLPTYYGGAASDYILDEIDLDGIGRLLALTPNDAVNALAALHFEDVFGRKEVYQLPLQERREGEKPVDSPERLGGRFLFHPELTHLRLSHLFTDGAELKVNRLTAEFDFDAFQDRHGAGAYPLFVITESGALQVVTAGQKLAPRPGQTLVSLIPPSS